MQPLGEGVYRVLGVWIDPTTGRYITGQAREELIARLKQKEEEK